VRMRRAMGPLTPALSPLWRERETARSVTMTSIGVWDGIISTRQLESWSAPVIAVKQMSKSRDLPKMAKLNSRLSKVIHGGFYFMRMSGKWIKRQGTARSSDKSQVAGLPRPARANSIRPNPTESKQKCSPKGVGEHGTGMSREPAGWKACVTGELFPTDSNQCGFPSPPRGSCPQELFASRIVVQPLCRGVGMGRCKAE